MSQTNQTEVISFLRRSGVLTEDEIINLHTARNEVILAVLIDKRAVLPSEEELARNILKDLTLGSNHVKRVRAQISFLNMITQNMNKRISVAGTKLREQKDRISGDKFPALGNPIKSEV
jgi:hypothetical protein